MKIIVGLGNPGKEYDNTRHNVGFYLLDQLAKHKRLAPAGDSLKFSKNTKLKAEIAETKVGGERVVLVKPLTFMNLSGEAVKAVLEYFKADISDLLVVCDDLNLRLGVSRLRLSGTSGGHKGLQNIIDSLDTFEFKRLRLGISKHNLSSQESEQIYEKIEAKKFVLARFDKREKLQIEKIVAMMVELIVRFVGKKEDLKAHTYEI